MFLCSLLKTRCLCTGWYNGINWLAAVWMRRADRVRRRWGGGGMEGTMLAGAGTGAPSLSPEGPRAAGSGG